MNPEKIGVNAPFGTVTVENLINEADAQTGFVELSFELYNTPNFSSSKITETLVEKLKLERLLLLGGSSSVNKDNLARDIAYYLSKKLSWENQKNVTEEWDRSSSLRGIDVKFQKKETSSILVLTRVIPKDVEIEIHQIQKFATLGNHYVVLSTDSPFTAWKLSDSTQVFWRELEVEEVADCERLKNTYSTKESIHQWFNEKRDRPREQLLALGLSFFSGLRDDQFFAALEEVVEQTWKRRDESLRSLDYCDFDNLRDLFNFTKTKAEGTLIQTRNPKQRQILFEVVWESHRRQILSALPVLVDIARKSVAEEFLNQELYGTEAKRIQIRKVISEIICDIGSISESAIASTLRQLAENENIFVQLVAAQAMAGWRDPDYDLNKQLFDTLRRWYDEIQSQLLREQVDAFIKGKKTSNETSKPHDYIKVTVALTVGLAALYDPSIEVLDSKGLSKELFDLIKELAYDSSSRVRKIFLDYTLPMVLQIHLFELREWLLNFVKQQTSSSDSELETVKLANEGVGKSLAFAYTILPNITKKLLDDWTKEAHKIPSSNIEALKITARESLIATVARTYGAIKFKQSETNLSPTSVLERLHNLFKTEKHTFVREAILEAIIEQASRNLRGVESQLQTLITDAKDYEREHLLKALGKIYCQQRAELKGGDYWISLNDYPYIYQIWLNSQRPQTEIEEIMYHWVENGNASIQQVAIRSLIYFAKLFDENEEREKQKILASLDEDEEKEGQNPLTRFDENSPPEKSKNSNYGVLFILSWLTIILKGLQYLTFKNKFYDSFAQEWSYYRKVISGILPELLKQNSFSESGVGSTLKKQRSTVKKTLTPLTGVDLVLNKLTSLSNRKIKIIADLLKLSIWIYRNLAFIIIGILAALVFRNPFFVLTGLGVFVAFAVSRSVLKDVVMSRGTSEKRGFWITLLFVTYSYFFAPFHFVSYIWKRVKK